MRKLFLLVTLPLFALDFATKAYIVHRFYAPGATRVGALLNEQPLTYEVLEHQIDRIVVIDGFFEIVRIHNTGIAFGMANGTASANLIFGGVALAALLLIWWLWRTNAFPTRLSKTAVSLLLAGIFGNLLDRILRGYVVDFLYFYARIDGQEKHFPAFNVADSCITVAAALLFLSAFQKAPARQPVKAAP